MGAVVVGVRRHLRRAGPHVSGHRGGLDPRNRPGAAARRVLEKLGPSNEARCLANAFKTHAPVVVGQSPKSVSAANALGGIPPTPPRTPRFPAVKGPDVKPYLVTFPGLLRQCPPEPGSRRRRAGALLTRSGRKQDGIVAARSPWRWRAGDAYAPCAPPLEMLRVVTGAGPPSPGSSPTAAGAGSPWALAPASRLPTDQNAQLWVPLHQPRTPHPLRLGQGRDGRRPRPPPMLRGKLVLIGTWGRGAAGH